MTRVARVVVVVAVPAETALLDADVAGRPARDHLFERIGTGEGIQIHSGTTAPFDEISALVGADSGTTVLAVDARAWLSARAWARVIDEARHGGARFRVVDSATSGAPRTLAVCASGDSRETLLTALQRLASLGDGLSGWLPADGQRVLEVGSLDVPQPVSFLDSHAGLAAIEHDVLLARSFEMMNQGVRVRDPRNVYVRGDVRCGIGVELDVGVILEGRVVLGNRVRVGAHAIVRDSQVGDDSWIRPFSIVEGARIGANGVVGPYGRIRPDTTIGDQVQVGNYVEIKSSDVGHRTRINHHSFIGDATVGEGVTIGAGTITCNHDGAKVNRTVIEDGAYVGSGCKLVAPVRIHSGAFVAAGSTITEDAAPNTLTVARARQVTVPNWPGPGAGRSRV